MLSAIYTRAHTHTHTQVFTAETMLCYLRVFNLLWRAKRMEYCLANMWRDQTSNYRALYTIHELRPVLHQCNLLISAMVHFITQLQYYITFEVVLFWLIVHC